MRWKKSLQNWKLELANNAIYDSAWCADHEKVSITKLKIQFLTLKFFPEALRWKKFLYNWKIEFAKNAEYDSAWCAEDEKESISQSKNQFLGS